MGPCIKNRDVSRFIMIMADIIDIQYADLITMLYKIAIAEGAIIQCGKHITAVNPPNSPRPLASQSSTASPIDPPSNEASSNFTRFKLNDVRSRRPTTGPSVLLDTGEIVDDIDLLIGADGYTSLVRAVVERDSDDHDDSEEEDQEASVDGKLRLREGTASKTVIYTLSVNIEDLAEIGEKKEIQLEGEDRSEKDILWDYVKRPEVCVIILISIDEEMTVPKVVCLYGTLYKRAYSSYGKRAPGPDDFILMIYNLYSVNSKSSAYKCSFPSYLIQRQRRHGDVWLTLMKS